MKVRILNLLFISVIIALLAACDGSEEKTYSYYVQHPSELERDYNHCMSYPQHKMCQHIIKKYLLFKRNFPQHKSAVNLDNKMDVDLTNIDRSTVTSNLDIDK